MRAKSLSRTVSRTAHSLRNHRAHAQAIPGRDLGPNIPVNRPKVHTLLAHLRSTEAYEIVAASSELFEAGLKVHAERSDKEWSLTDCISFIVMETRGISSPLTHDQHFEQAGFEALLRRDPPP